MNRTAWSEWSICTVMFRLRLPQFHLPFVKIVSCTFFFQAEDGIRDLTVTGVQTCALPILLPAEASAKLDFRLIPDQDPDDVIQLLRKHLDRHGFQKVEIVASEGEKPARSDPNSTVAKTVIESVREMHGEPILWPFMPATGPMHPVVSDLGIPTVLPVGAGRPDNRIHAPNENIRAADYVNTVRLMCRIWERFGAS